MAKKYYAVRKGRKSGIFTTWDECKKQTDNYPGAVFKSFPTLNDAEAFLNITAAIAKTPEQITKGGLEAVAYVDGSYNNKTKEFSYGVVMFFDGKEEHFAEKFADPDLAEMRNVAGEIKGAEKAMKFCIENSINSIDIYYDYEGIQKWCCEEWKTNKTGTKAYKAFYDSIKDRLKVNFVKVVGHSGDKYNDLADKLAKSALGL